MKTSITKQNRFGGKVKYLIVAVIWLTIWEVSAVLANDPILFVPPHRGFVTFFKLASTWEFWKTVLTSVLRVLSGFVLGYISTALLSFCAYRSSFIKAFITPIINIIKATPVASFIIVMLMWAGKNFVPIFICVLMVTPIVWSNVLEGLMSVDKNLLEMADVYKMTTSEKIKHIYIPSLIPYNAAAVDSGLGLCWKAGVSAEVICRTIPSIGNSIWETKFYVITDELFAWTTMVVLLSLIFDWILSHAMNKVFRNYAVQKDFMRLTEDHDELKSGIEVDV